jgi:bacterial/archaeal transporter family-2 protein
VDKGLAVLLTAVVGGFIALQAPINAGLSKETGNFAAALVSFAVGTLLLAAIVGLAGKAGGIGGAVDVSWYYLLGGVLGAAYVTASLITVTSIGAGGVAAATIAGQISASVLLDRIGFLGLD